MLVEPLDDDEDDPDEDDPEEALVDDESLLPEPLDSEVLDDELDEVSAVTLDEPFEPARESVR